MMIAIEDIFGMILFIIIVAVLGICIIKDIIAEVVGLIKHTKDK